MSRRRAGGDDLIVERSGEHTLGRHVQMAHVTFKGEHQIAEVIVRAYPPFRSKVSQEGRSSQLDAFYDARLWEELDLTKRAGELEGILEGRLRIRVVEGEAATVIVREAERDGGRTLVAVGSRGLGPIKRMRLGSISTKVLRATEGPVLIHPPSHEPGEGRV